MSILSDLQKFEETEAKALEKQKSAFLESLETQKKNLSDELKKEVHGLSEEKVTIMQKAQGHAQKEAAQSLQEYTSMARKLSRSFEREKEAAVKLVLKEFVEQNV